MSPPQPHLPSPGPVSVFSRVPLSFHFFSKYSPSNISVSKPISYPYFLLSASPEYLHAPSKCPNTPQTASTKEKTTTPGPNPQPAALLTCPGEQNPTPADASRAWRRPGLLPPRTSFHTHQSHTHGPLNLSAQFSRSVMSDSLRPHEAQHARPPCLSPTPGVYSIPCPSSR